MDSTNPDGLSNDDMEMDQEEAEEEDEKNGGKKIAPSKLVRAEQSNDLACVLDLT